MEEIKGLFLQSSYTAYFHFAEIDMFGTVYETAVHEAFYSLLSENQTQSHILGPECDLLFAKCILLYSTYSLDISWFSITNSFA